MSLFLFFFNDTATTEIYTLSLHDALPILEDPLRPRAVDLDLHVRVGGLEQLGDPLRARQHEGRVPDDLAFLPGDRKSTRLNSRSLRHLVCRLLLEKKKNSIRRHTVCQQQR